MNPNPNKFKYVLMGVFVFFILIGLIAFSTYKSNSTANNNVEIKSASLAKGYSRQLRESFDFFAIGRNLIFEQCLKL